MAMEIIKIENRPEYLSQYSHVLVEKNRADKLIRLVLDNIKSELKLSSEDKCWLKLMKDLCDPYSTKTVHHDQQIFMVSNNDEIYYAADVYCDNKIGSEHKQRRLVIDLDDMKNNTSTEICAKFVKMNVSIINSFLIWYENEMELEIFIAEEAIQSDETTNRRIESLNEILDNIQKLKTNMYPTIIKELSRLGEGDINE